MGHLFLESEKTREVLARVQPHKETVEPLEEGKLHAVWTPGVDDASDEDDDDPSGWLRANAKKKNQQC